MRMLPDKEVHVRDEEYAALIDTIDAIVTEFRSEPAHDPQSGIRIGWQHSLTDVSEVMRRIHESTSGGRPGRPPGFNKYLRCDDDALRHLEDLTARFPNESDNNRWRLLVELCVRGWQARIAYEDITGGMVLDRLSDRLAGTSEAVE